jgi:uncharacterized protein
MQAVALRMGMILNQADVPKDCGLSPATAHRYIRLIEVSHLVARVPAFSKSRKKRIVKSPKFVFLDPAITSTTLYRSSWVIAVRDSRHSPS